MIQHMGILFGFAMLVLASFIIGCFISSFFVQRRGEDRYFFRTYQLYKEGKVDRLTVIYAAIINTAIGAVIVIPVALKFFFLSIS